MMRFESWRSEPKMSTLLSKNKQAHFKTVLAENVNHDTGFGATILVSTFFVSEKKRANHIMNGQNP
jgi:hypothetical protein